jgi:DNA-binding IclR family transcriptional regulator
VSERRVQAVERSLDLAFALADGPLTLTELAHKTALSKPTAFRLLGTLTHRGIVVRSGTGGRYALGPGVLRLQQGVTRGLGVVATLARPALEALWRATAETVAVHVRIGVERMCVEELASPSPIRYVATVGAMEPLHVGSAGKVLLAFTEDPELERLLPNLALQAVTSRTITDVDELRRELLATRDRGWAMSDGERIVGAAALSVPVQGRDGFVAALSILGPASRLSRSRRLGCVPVMQSAAAEIERALGRGSPRSTVAAGGER